MKQYETVPRPCEAQQIQASDFDPDSDTRITGMTYNLSSCVAHVQHGYGQGFASIGDWVVRVPAARNLQEMLLFVVKAADFPKQYRQVAEGVVTVELSCGSVQEIHNVPSGVVLHVHDYDVDAIKDVPGKTPGVMRDKDGRVFRLVTYQSKPEPRDVAAEVV